MKDRIVAAELIFSLIGAVTIGRFLADLASDLVELREEFHDWHIAVFLPLGLLVWIFETFVTAPPIELIYAAQGRAIGKIFLVFGQVWTLLISTGLIILQMGG